MSIEQAEQLKREWTDKYVVVDSEVPQLKRFQHLTGKVKTVNMNCMALVEFNGPEDIGWYDIDLNSLRVVDKPQPKKKAAAPAESGEKPAAKKTAPKKGGKSPLELAREQAAGGKPAEKAPAGKKLSPLEMARQQAAAKSSGSDDGDSPAEEKPAPAKPKAAADGKKLSPLELARMQDAKKNE